jgi:histone acetyltransferase 1
VLAAQVCQVLVLPPHRRRGHASSLLSCLYAHAAQHDAVELTVEDPSPAFRLVRDLVDLRLCRKKNLLVPPGAGVALPEPARSEARHALRITDEQIARCYEMRALEMLNLEINALPENKGAPDSSSAAGPATAGAPLSEAAEALTRPFRLNVKRRLNKKHEEQLKAIGEPKARKEELEALYQALVAEYRLLLARGRESRWGLNQPASRVQV